MLKKGDKIRRVGPNYFGVKNGEIYTFDGYKDSEHVFLKGYGDEGFSMEKFVLVQKAILDHNDLSEFGDLFYHA